VGAVAVDPGQAGAAGQVVLLAADGIGTNEIARRTGASKPRVILRKKRYAAEGIGGPEDPAQAGQAAECR
jgi:hypothetical protein